LRKQQEKRRQLEDEQLKKLQQEKQRQLEEQQAGT
jgi:hypothetical protein